MKKALSRLACLLLALALLCTSALALTVDEARELLDVYYVDEVPAEVLEQPTIEGMLAALGDPYTAYFGPAAYQDFLSSMLDTDIVGIGVLSSVTGDGLLVELVYAESPAERGGLRAGDVITAVDGHAAAGESQETVSAWLRGEAGTSVTVTVLRDGQSLTYTLIRERVVAPATTTSLMDGHIGYIRCTTFGDQTYGHFEDGIETYGDESDRWIVDLRGNGGGGVAAAVDAASAFTGGGVLAYMRMKGGIYETYGSDKSSFALDPVIVLVDGGTASASELFASAVRDAGAGIVVGSRTFGKGLGQILLDERTLPELFADGSGFKITASRVFSAGGATTDKVGVIPHLLVDDSQTEKVARLLSASNPTSSTRNYLRLDMTWRWYVDLDQAMSEEWSDAFAALLEAIPPTAKLWVGVGGANDWEGVTAAQVAERYHLGSYESRGFDDVAGTGFQAATDTLATYGILKGDGTGSYGPDKTLTRAEFCSMLAQAVGYKASAPVTFGDVAPDAWYAGSVAALAEVGLVKGYTDGLFHPDDTLSHQQFIAVMARLGEWLCVSFDRARTAGPEAPLDGGAYADYDGWARESLWLLSESQMSFVGYVNLLWDDPANIPARAPTTRAEAAALLYSVLYFGGVLPG